jgi:glutamate-1-semialdehyde aminotransferase
MKRLNLEKSKKLFKEGSELVPGSVLGVRRPYNFIVDEYPIFLDSAKGCRITDVDGNTFIDMLAAYGPIIIGYREKEIDDAVIKQLRDKGFCMALTQDTQNQLVSKLKKLIPSCEKAVIVKTGSDASTLAIRIARAYTKKNKILRCGYHGWHDWCVEDKGGIPKSAYQEVIEFEYNNLDILEDLLISNSGEVAAIIIQPIFTPLVKEVQMPNNKYLNSLKELSRKHNCLLIFDEIRSGFRVNIGGAQKEFNVIPDITLLGKAMANGYPISAVVGKKEVMNMVAHKVFVSSTYFPNSIEQIAALKTIEILERENVLEDIRKKGKIFSERIKEIIKKSNINCKFSGAPWMPFISFNEEKETTNRKMRNLFYTNLIRLGIFLSPFHHGYIMFRHTKENLNEISNCIEESLFFLNKNL